MRVVLFLFFSLIFFCHPSFQTKIIVSNWTSMAECKNLFEGVSMNISNFNENCTGFLPEIFSNVFKDYSWQNFSFYCLSWNKTIEFISNLQNSQLNDEYVILGPLPSNFDINNSNSNLIPSYPIYSSHLYMVQQPNYTLEMYFYYMNAFDYVLWLFLVFLIFVSGHLLWFFERSDDNKMPMKYLEGIKEASWQIFLYFFLMGNRPIRSMPGRCLICALFVTSYVIFVYFMGSTVSRMINNYEYIQFRSLFSLTSNDVVYTFKEYEGIIRNYNQDVKIKSYDWSFYNAETLIEIAKKQKGLIFLPNFLAEASIDSSCSLRKSSPYIQTNFYLSFFYSKNLNPLLASFINQAITAFRSSYKYTISYNYRFIFNNNIENCNKSNIDFSEIYGIWIIFCCGLFLSFMSFGIRVLLKKYITKNEDHYDKIFGKNPLRRGFKRLIYEEKKLIQQALIEYFDRILMIYESKHKEILKNMKRVVEEKRDSIEKVEEKLKELHSQIDY